MNKLFEVYENVSHQYTYLSQRFPIWAFLILMAVLIIGIVVAAANRNKHNFSVWIVLVAMFPVFGSLTAIALAIIFAVLKKKNGFKPKEYFLNKVRVFVIAIITFAAGIYVNNFNKGANPYINEAFVAGIALLCIFVSYFYTLRRYSREAKYIQICRLDGHIYKNSVNKTNYVSLTFPSELLPSVYDVAKIKDMFFESYGFAPRFDGEWQYVLNGVNDRFVFDSYTEKEYLERFDVESTSYIGKGIVKINALMWFWSDSYGVVVRNNHVGQSDTKLNREYEEYDGTPVQEVVLYRCQQSPKKLIIETLELIAAVFIFATPFGAWLHSATLSGITSLFEMIF